MGKVLVIHRRNRTARTLRLTAAFRLRLTLCLSSRRNQFILIHSLQRILPCIIAIKAGYTFPIHCVKQYKIIIHRICSHPGIDQTSAKIGHCKLIAIGYLLLIIKRKNRIQCGGDLNAYIGIKAVIFFIIYVQLRSCAIGYRQ